MIERVARAIALEQTHADWRTCLPAARAAVLALKEPSDSMLEAALPGSIDWGYLPEDWSSMITCVMREEPEKIT